MDLLIHAVRKESILKMLNWTLFRNVPKQYKCGINGMLRWCGIKYEIIKVFHLWNLWKFSICVYVINKASTNSMHV